MCMVGCDCCLALRFSACVARAGKGASRPSGEKRTFEGHRRRWVNGREWRGCLPFVALTLPSPRFSRSQSPLAVYFHSPTSITGSGICLVRVRTPRRKAGNERRGEGIREEKGGKTRIVAKKRGKRKQERCESFAKANETRRASGERAFIYTCTCFGKCSEIKERSGIVRGKNTVTDDVTAQSFASAARLRSN